MRRKKRIPSSLMYKVISDIIGTVFLIWFVFKVEIFSSASSGDKVSFFAYVVNLFNMIS